jgi:hypothetical protein
VEPGQVHQADAGFSGNACSLELYELERGFQDAPTAAKTRSSSLLLLKAATSIGSLLPGIVTTRISITLLLMRTSALRDRCLPTTQSSITFFPD